MKIENKTLYYFTEYEKGLFTDFLWQSKNTMSDFADKCGMSITLLSLIVNGKRPFTNEYRELFERNGFKL